MGTSGIFDKKTGIGQSNILLRSPLLVDAFSEEMKALESEPRNRRRERLSRFFGLTRLRPDEAGLLVAFSAGEILPYGHMQQMAKNELSPTMIRKAFRMMTGLSDKELIEKVSEGGRYSELLPREGDDNADYAQGIQLTMVKTWFEEVLNYLRAPEELIETIVKHLQPTTSRCLLRILEGDAPSALNVEGVLDALAATVGIEAEKVYDCYHLTNSLEDTAERAFRGRRALAQVHCRTGRPYRLTSPVLTESVEDAFGRCEGAAFAEVEVPGLRVEIHRRHASIQLFTRSMLDVSRAFPEICEALEKGLVGTDDVIAEGQIFVPGASPEECEREIQLRIDQRPTTRGDVLKPTTLMSVAMIDLTRQGREDLMGRPYSARRERLTHIFKPTERVQLVEGERVESVSAAEEFLKSAQEKGYSGIILRPATSYYAPGVAKNWYRVTSEDLRLDLCVIQATYTSTGTLSRVTLACQTDSGLAAIGDLSSTGADADQWALLQKSIEPLRMTPTEKTAVVPHVVVEVAPKSWRSSPRRPSGYSISAPVLCHVRLDKGPREVENRASLDARLGTDSED